MVRSYGEWDIDLSKMDEATLPESEKLRVDVTSYTVDQEIEVLGRSSAQIRIATDVAIRKRFGPNHQEESSGRIAIGDIDALMLFVDEVVALLANHKLNELPAVSWDSTSIIEAPVREHLRELRQFTGVIRTTYLSNMTI